MKLQNKDNTEDWQFKNDSKFDKEPEIVNKYGQEVRPNKLITCQSYNLNGNQCITLPSKMNSENYSKYGVVKPDFKAVSNQELRLIKDVTNKQL